MSNPYVTRLASLLTAAAVVLFSIPANAVDLDLSQTPLYLSPSVPPLNMLVVGRDHKLYYEAYNDYTDLNDDDVLDTKYKPLEIDYYGYFDSNKCYTYSSSSKRFDPTRAATSGTKACGGSGEWSGDWLNYVTTARIDALRKVLYGGYRSTDTASATVLERTLLPQDAHSWGKEYTSVAVDGYNIRNYTPLSVPTTATSSTTYRHFFANTTLYGASEPLLRVLTNRTERIWNWVSIERPVAGSRMNNGSSGATISPSPTDYSVRVSVCVSGLLESNCEQYSGGYKPIGLLQEFGENDSMYFGLITGSYRKNTSGGVLRKRMSSISTEINTDGTFKTASADAGIIASLNRLRVTGFNSSYQYSCGWNAANRTITEGECQMWGNPIAEMMYEALRYFAGKGAASSAFDISSDIGEESSLPSGGLPRPSWNNPYGTNGYPSCSKPFETVVSDINPSYDTDQLPGSAYGSFSSDISGLSVSSLGQTIWNNEFGAVTKSVFIGDVGGSTDGAPTAKNVSSFGNIRGLSPEEPTKQGGYYAASVAYYGLTQDINATAEGTQNMQTFAVALASPLPRISIPVGNGRYVTLVPFAKSVAGSSISATQGQFQPTDQIVDFYVDTLTDTYGKFRVNFEDVEQGADHDMDAIAIYEYQVTNGTVSVKLTSEYAAGGITQHMGYVISGTTRDGIYLEVLDQRDGDSANDTDYFLDTPASFTGTPPAPSSGTGRWNDGAALPFVTTRTFTPGSSTGATLLEDPLYYAAKYGGFEDTNDNDLPDQQAEWDTDTTGSGAGVPDNYFLVTNASKLSEQLRAAFQEIIDRTTAASSASVNSGSLSTDTRIYQAKFNTNKWTGELLAYGFEDDGSLDEAALWNAADMLPAADNRKIITVNSDGAAVPFRWSSLDATRRAQLSSVETTQQQYVNYLRGDGSLEGTTGSALRERGDIKLGDIVSSAPIYVGAPNSRFSTATLPANDPEKRTGAQSYSDFASENSDRTPMVYAGANDGMLHGFNAETGREVFAFIPTAVFENLKQLPRQTYSHRYYADGSPNSSDVFYGGEWHTVLVGGLNLGGQSIYALDITRPATLANAEGVSTGTPSTNNPDTIHLWEFTDADDRDLGYTYSQPAVVRLHNGRWAAVFGNGYNATTDDTSTGGQVSSTGNAVLYVVDIETGELIKKFDTGIGMSDSRAGGKPNGLATPTLVDLDGDDVVDFAYAGDLLGNLWKFNLESDDESDWRIAFGAENAWQPLFKAVDSSGNAQPITERAEVSSGPYGVGVIVLFGTGKYLESSDKTVSSSERRVQTFYGVVDKDNYDEETNTYLATDQVTRSVLLQQTILSETDGVRQTSANAMGDNYRGFYLDLINGTNYTGERSVSDPLVSSGRVIFTTLIPNDEECGYGGSSWLMALDLTTGAQLSQAQFDTNGDGVVNDQDSAGSGTYSSDEILSRPESLLCLSGSCTDDQLLSSGSSGELNQEALRSTPGLQGRQSWRQIR